MKFKYIKLDFLENEKSFWSETKNIFSSFPTALLALKNKRARMSTKRNL